MITRFILTFALAALWSPLVSTAQSTYPFFDQENNTSASGSGSFDLNSNGPNAVYSITVEAGGSIGGQVDGPYRGSASVSLNSYTADDNEGPMNGSTHADAAINLNNITRRGDGHWIANNGWDLGTGVISMSASVYMSGDGYGDCLAYAQVSWTIANAPPSIAWTSTPGTVASGQNYTVSAHGHDPDGNLTQVNVWKNGQPFAFGGGGNGTDADSGNPTSDPGPQTITFTAQAVDATGATSAMISQTVTVTAPNNPPTISWNSNPGTVASGQSYTVSAHGHDQDGNLTQVNVWQNGQPFAIGGGGNGTDADSGNATSDTGPQTIIFTAQAVDATGATSAMISQTVTIAAPNHPPTISWNSNPGTVASGQSYTISAHGHDQDGNLSQVNVWKNGQPFASGGGGNDTDADSGNTTSDTGPQTFTYTAQAVDATGAVSALISQTVTVSPPNHPPTISWTSTPGTVASGQNYTISAHGHDQDGNLTQVTVWKDGQPFASAAGGNGTDADCANATSDAGPLIVTFTAQAVDSDGATSALISQTVTISAPNHAPTISWNATIGTVASGLNYTISAHGHDQDGNLTQVNVWKNGLPFAFGGGGNGTDADSGNPTSDTGPQTVIFTAQAVDANGATSSIISQTVAIAAPPPPQYTLTTIATPGGAVSSGGTFVAGTVVNVSAFPDAMHDFSGWSGDAAGTANPVSVTLDRSKTVQANFTPKIYALVTNATAGGSVTPGGSYPVGTTVTISATPDATHYFVDWSGDASGTALAIDVTLDRPKSAQANFAPKTAQTITFDQPGDQAVGSQPFAPSASSSSGLPVTFTVVSGPATVTGGLVQVTGFGAVMIQASQPGDTFYLPAAPVTLSFNVIAPVQLKYRGPSRTLLSDPHTSNGAPLVIQVP